MKTTIDKAGPVVIPAAVREQAGFEPGTTLEISIDEFGSGSSARRPVPGSCAQGGLVARPVLEPAHRPLADIAALVDEERNRWP